MNDHETEAIRELAAEVRRLSRAVNRLSAELESRGDITDLVSAEQVTEAIRRGVDESFPWPSEIANAISDGTREALRSKRGGRRS